MTSERAKLSVVIATYNRPALIERLLGQLAEQTLPGSDFEVVVVDDGSKEPVRPLLTGRSWPFSLRVEEQANAGQATARHRGILAASGEVLVIVDDDMQVGPGFLEHHLALHLPGSRRVVLGRIRPPPSGMALPERWHQRNLDRVHERAKAGVLVRGNSMYTGNVSFRRSDYLAVGGFDTSLRQAEDVELGRRFNRYGAEFVLSDEAYTVNGSDHTSVARWRSRARNYGRLDLVISRKNPDLVEQRPWDLNPRLAISAFFPPVGMALAPLAWAVAVGLDRAGLEGPAFTAATVTYGLDYYLGVRDELRSTGAVMRDFADWWLDPSGLPPERKRALLRRFLASVRADHSTIRRYQQKYASQVEGFAESIALDAVKKIGFQLMVAVRWMHLLRDAGLRLPAMAMSRFIRHTYGSDIHWDAEFAPGVVIVHGMGLAVSRAARIGPGCIINQNVTLGLGNAPGTRDAGAPFLEKDVHVGPGCTLIGPITVGAGSKLMAGSVLDRSVPPRSVVVPPQAEVRTREAALEPVPGASGARKAETGR